MGCWCLSANTVSFGAVAPILIPVSIWIGWGIRIALKICDCCVLFHCEVLVCRSASLWKRLHQPTVVWRFCDRLQLLLWNNRYVTYYFREYVPCDWIFTLVSLITGRLDSWKLIFKLLVVVQHVSWDEDYSANCSRIPSIRACLHSQGTYNLFLYFAKPALLNTNAIVIEKFDQSNRTHRVTEMRLTIWIPFHY